KARAGRARPARPWAIGPASPGRKRGARDDEMVWPFAVAPPARRAMSSLVKSVGTIGGLTLVSRIFGFVRDMLLARVLGAGLAADAFQLAFTLPNTFRRLFAEGAFSVAFVPMYSRALHGAQDEESGEAAAARFADDVLA